MSKKPCIWIGFGLRNRNCAGTYDKYDYNSLPPIKIDSKFENILTYEDIKKEYNMLNELFDSPTACYFSFDDKTKTFYRDQQDCVIWNVNEYGQVEVDKDCVVADSIPEFLTRMYIENRSWIQGEKGGEDCVEYLAFYEKYPDKRDSFFDKLFKKFEREFENNSESSE